jgi:hypothetical protein
LRSTGLPRVRSVRFVMHCVTEPSCP